MLLFFCFVLYNKSGNIAKSENIHFCQIRCEKQDNHDHRQDGSLETWAAILRVASFPTHAAWAGFS